MLERFFFERQNIVKIVFLDKQMTVKLFVLLWLHHLHQASVQHYSREQYEQIKQYYKTNIWNYLFVVRDLSVKVV